ncbi:MAG: EamA family transporter [Propionibacterium sp.]|nr:EamA family transporter [Propionibacterium sp.]
MIPIGVLAASLSALCYGVTPACARRSIRLLGFAWANVWRLVVALVVIGLLAVTVGRGLGDQAAAFALAGAVGFGLGGFAMFRALPLLGAPLASLVVETTAAIVAGALAWVWFADAVSLPYLVFSLIMLAGVVLGLLPYVRGAVRHPRLRAGLLFALVSALAQAFSGVLSRKALLAAQQVANARGAGVSVGKNFAFVFSAAFDRLAGGLVVALALVALAVVLRRRAAWARASLTPLSRGAEWGAVWTTPDPRVGRVLPDRPWFWVGINALFGPILGVTSMVWALQYLQPGVAQAIAALAPLIAIPSARWLEGYRPPRRFALGVVIAVAGLAGLALS